MRILSVICSEAENRESGVEAAGGDEEAEGDEEKEKTSDFCTGKALPNLY
jgi:hypothetical protein